MFQPPQENLPKTPFTSGGIYLEDGLDESGDWTVVPFFFHRHVSFLKKAAVYLVGLGGMLGMKFTTQFY